jgi:hypothetical protein
LLGKLRSVFEKKKNERYFQKNKLNKTKKTTKIESVGASLNGWWPPRRFGGGHMEVSK